MSNVHVAGPVWQLQGGDGAHTPRWQQNCRWQTQGITSVVEVRKGFSSVSLSISVWLTFSFTNVHGWFDIYKIIHKVRNVVIWSDDQLREFMLIELEDDSNRHHMQLFNNGQVELKWGQQLRVPAWPLKLAVNLGKFGYCFSLIKCRSSWVNNLCGSDSVT